MYKTALQTSSMRCETMIDAHIMMTCEQSPARCHPYTLVRVPPEPRTLNRESHLQLADEGDVGVVHDDEARRRRPRLGTNGKWLAMLNSETEQGIQLDFS